MRNLRYMCAQPSSDYYLWQVETVIHNFAKHGINPNNLDIVCAIPPNGSAPEKWRKMADTYNTVRFFFYEDLRSETPYVSSVRPNILKQHFTNHPEMKDEAIYYFDCDCIFTRPPDFSKFLDDDTTYGSDCQFYVGAAYLMGKGFGIYEKFCEICNIDPTIPIMNETNVIGAQHILKNIDAKFWEDIEVQSDAMYRFCLDDLTRHPEVSKDDAIVEGIMEYNPVQKFCCDMYAMFFNVLKRGEVRNDLYLDFCWSTQDKAKWDSCVIYHNAGCLNTQADQWFYKGQFVNGKLPYEIENYVDPKWASHWYLKEVLETGEKTCLVNV